MEMEKKEHRRLRKLRKFFFFFDIRYRGPISYQGFQILGWICIVLSIMLALLGIASNFVPAIGERFVNLRLDLSTIAGLALPFLLIANFSRILSNAEGYKVLLLRNGGIALGIIVVSVFFFMHHVVETLEVVVQDRNQVLDMLTKAISEQSKGGLIAFNLFMDLFLCTLAMYFLNAHPRRFFTGKKVLILRACAVLPVAYEVVSMILKYEAVNGKLLLPLWVYPLMPVKPIMTFVLFLFLAIHVKAREYRFCKGGRTHEEYMEFQKTNQNSFHFGVLLAISMLITGIIDSVLAEIISNYQMQMMGVLGDLDQEMQVYMNTFTLGFGKASASMIIAAPLMLLYSFNRVPKRKIISLLIPVAAIVLILILALEGIHFGLGEFLRRLTDETGLITGVLGSAG